mmetsp:Transcript_19846/g.34093  ORF Transcript_19846/g.34093 Transcript_19846/m.34093 type:complete len:102 (+) Transcript_19846:350-655(+)
MTVFAQQLLSINFATRVSPRWLTEASCSTSKSNSGQHQKGCGCQQSPQTQKGLDMTLRGRIRNGRFVRQNVKPGLTFVLQKWIEETQIAIEDVWVDRKRIV